MPISREFYLLTSFVINQCNRISHNFERFVRIFLLTKSEEVELLVVSGVDGCGCPRAIRRRQVKIISWALTNIPAVLALEANVTTCLKNFYATWKGALDEIDVIDRLEDK